MCDQRGSSFAVLLSVLIKQSKLLDNEFKHLIVLSIGTNSICQPKIKLAHDHRKNERKLLFYMPLLNGRFILGYQNSAKSLGKPQALKDFDTFFVELPYIP